MRNYELTIENGEITWIETREADGTPISGILYIPKEAECFSVDAWTTLDDCIEGIVVDEDNRVFSSAHNCLLSKDGSVLIKTCKGSDISKLTGIKAIGANATSVLGLEWDKFVLSIPAGVEVLDYRAFGLAAEEAEITVPASVQQVKLMAFMIHGNKTHIIFEGDPALEVGVFGTAAEAKDSDFELYRTMPEILYPKVENIIVTCKPDSRVAAYCKKYGIPVEV